MPQSESASKRGAAPDDSGLLARVFSWIVTHHVREGEPVALSHGDLRSLSADLGVTPDALLAAFPDDGDERALMDQMIRAHGLTPAVIHAMPAALLRDLETTCAQCGSKGRCRRDLKAGTAAANSAAYCGNAEAFEAIASAHRHS
jgi:hypothetical protein